MNETTFITLVSETCCVCGVIFGMEKEYRQRMLDVGGSFTCPSGHKQHYSESTVEKLKKELAFCRNTTMSLRTRLKEKELSLAATKGHLTRMKNRAKRCINCGQTEGEVYQGQPHDHVCADCGREIPYNQGGE